MTVAFASLYRKRKSLTTFWVLLSKMRWWRLCQCRSRQGLDREPASRLLWLLVIATGMLDWGSSAPRKWPQPLEVPSCWLRSLSSQCAWGTGVTRLVNLIRCLARYCSKCRVSVMSVKMHPIPYTGDGQVWVCAGAPHSCTQRHWNCVSACTQKASPDGRCWRLLDMC